MSPEQIRFDPDRFSEIAGAIADGVPVDWSLVHAARSLSEKETAAFRTLELMRRIQGTITEEAQEFSTQDDLYVETGFEILEELGRGAHSKVFRAVDRALDREVALKVLKNTVLPSVRERKRFLKEARTLASLDHPNIVRMLSIDQTDGALRLCLEKIDGRTLADRIGDEGPFALDETVRIGVDLCRALKALHAKGLVHRDLKPTNVMRTSEGRVVLLDFGLAHSIGPADLRTDRGMTGTPLVMAPEQFTANGSMAPSVDIYALGVLLYWMVSGRFPYEAETYHALRRRVLEGKATPLRKLCPDLPRRFRRIVHRAIAPRPERRFASAHAFEEALLRYERRAATGVSRKILPWVVAVVIVLGAGYGAYRAFFGRTIESGPVTITAATGEKLIVSARLDSGGEFDIFSMDPDGTGRINLTADYPYDALSPRLSPDGTRIVFIKREKVARALCGMFADGSAKREIVTHDRGVGPGQPEWIDNRTLSYQADQRTGKSSLRAVGFNGQAAELPPDAQPPADPPTESIPLLAFGAEAIDGADRGEVRLEKILFAAKAGEDGETDIYCINPDGTQEINLTPDFKGDAHQPVLSPDGRFVAFLQRKGDNDHIWTMACDGSLRSLLTAVTSDYRIVGWLDSETVIYSCRGLDEGSLDVWVVDRKGNACFWFEAGGPGQPEVLAITRTAAGDRFAAVERPRAGNALLADVGILDPDSGRVTPLAVEQAEWDDRAPLWSTDGGRLFWSRAQVGPDGAGVAYLDHDDVNESGELILLDHPGGNDSVYPCAASPGGGKILLCCRSSDSAMELVVHDLRGDAGEERSLVFDRWSIEGADWGYVVGAH